MNRRQGSLCAGKYVQTKQKSHARLVRKLVADNIRLSVLVFCLTLEAQRIFCLISALNEKQG